MSAYYGDIPLCSNEDLEHHGIKGMKWGVRRYQNEDGSLTDAGKARYGGQTDYSHKDFNISRRIAKTSLIGRRHLRNWREGHLERAIEKTKANAPGDQKRLERQQAKLEAQRASNANLKAYERHHSTGKLMAQQLLMGSVGADNYRHARARGSGRLRSLFESGAGILPVGSILRYLGDREDYGKVAWSDSSEGEVM